MAKEALLIVDMSNDFVADNGTLTVGKPAQEIVPYIQDLATSFFRRGKCCCRFNGCTPTK